MTVYIKNINIVISIELHTQYHLKAISIAKKSME